MDIVLKRMLSGTLLFCCFVLCCERQCSCVSGLPCVYAHSVSAPPLLDGDVLAIKEHLIDELDYILIPTEGWNKLLSWYGLKDNQEPISRKVRARVVCPPPPPPPPPPPTTMALA